jgi:DNA anti-recombination protein RmuC
MTIDDLAVAINTEFKNIYKRFDAVDERFNAVDRRFDAMDKRFDDTERHFNARFDEFSGRVQGVEKPLDSLVRERLRLTEKNWL